MLATIKAVWNFSQSFWIGVIACTAIATFLGVFTDLFDLPGSVSLWILMVTILGVAMGWKHTKDIRGALIGTLVVAFILFTFVVPGRDKFFGKIAESTHSYFGDVVKAGSVATEPLPKKVVTVKFGPNERVLTGAMQKRDQWAEIKPTVPVKIKYPAEPSGYRVISSSLKSQNVTCDLGEIVLYSGDKPGEATISLY